MKISAVLLLGILSAAAIAAAPKPDNPPLDRASAAYNNFANCAECHDSFAVNSGNGAVGLSGLPGEYVPGNTYTVTVTLQDPGQQHWGYELTALDGGGLAIGALVNPDVNSQVRTQGGREFASHQSGGTFQGVLGGPVSWTVDWLAPAAGSGTAYFYVSGNAANNGTGARGDYIYQAAVASAESGSVHPAATVILQGSYPDATGSNQLRRGTDRLRARIHVTNHKTVGDTYSLATRVRLPNGSPYPPTGYITTCKLTLGPGETGTVDFDIGVPGKAPLGFYGLEALTGFAPKTLVHQDSMPFEVIN